MRPTIIDGSSRVLFELQIAHQIEVPGTKSFSHVSAIQMFSVDFVVHWRLHTARTFPIKNQKVRQHRCSSESERMFELCFDWTWASAIRTVALVATCVNSNQIECREETSRAEALMVVPWNVESPIWSLATAKSIDRIVCERERSFDSKLTQMENCNLREFNSSRSTKVKLNQTNENWRH